MAAMALPIIGGISSLLGGFIGSGAAKRAAAVEAGTFGRNAEQLSEVGQQQLKPQISNTAPYILRGQNAFNTLASQLRTPGQGLLQTYQPFQAPTGLDYTNDPGYQARMQLGEQAIQNSAAAQGDLYGGNTLRALTDYGQTFGSNEYGNVYNRALQNYLTNAQNFYTGQGNEYSRLMGTAGMGLNATQLQDQARQNYVNTYGQAMGMSNQGAEAQAAGIMGSANAWQQALGGIAGTAQFASLMNQLGGPAGGASTAAMTATPGILDASAIGPQGAMPFGGSPFVPGVSSGAPQFNSLQAQLSQSGMMPSTPIGAGPAPGGFNVGAWPNVTTSQQYLGLAGQ